MMPPQPSYLWRSRGVSAWNSRYSDWPILSAKDDTWGGEAFALREVLRHAWYQCTLANGLSVKHCPIKGLFAGLDDAAASGSASSSCAPK